MFDPARKRPWLAALLIGLGVALATGAAPADDPAALAREILDDAKPEAQREAIIRDHPALSAELIAALTADLKPGTAEEYRRIPWVWRVSIAAGKRANGEECRRILDVALPRPGQPLDDWRAVVLGGGLVNGLTLSGHWPDKTLSAITKTTGDHAARWRRALEQAVVMADDPKVKTGTRYDALRLVGMLPWDLSGAQIKRYLANGVHAELQQGAVGAAGDVHAPEAAEALIAGFPHFTEGNRVFAIRALLRDASRADALLAAVADGRLSKADVLAAIKETGDESEFRKKAEKALTIAP